MTTQDAALPPPRAGRHAVVRRPSGEKPPLPRRIHRQGWLMLLGLAVLVALWAWITTRTDLDSWLAQASNAVLGVLEHLRAGPGEAIAEAVASLDLRPVVVAVTAAVVVAMLLFKRVQRVLVLGAAVLVALLLGDIIQGGIDRPRPVDVEILGRWAGEGGVNIGLVQLAVVLVGAAVSLAPKGRPRKWANVGVGVLLGLVVLADGIQATDYVSDSIGSVLLGGVVAVALFWWFTPDEVQPVVYRRGKSAHLDLGGERGEAIRRAVDQQLGHEVTAIKPFGLAGSAGSSPMRLTVAGEPGYLFAKLFSQQHVRADRLYKLTRAILYGRLEDESPFTSARRLAEFEDYTLRSFRDAGVPVVASYGVVELTPEREYMLVTEFADGAREIGDPEVVVDDGVIDSGLLAVRRLWDGGLAHRDVKPANVLVKDGRVRFIDTGFSAIRPSPWRQAVDLANMLLCLAVRTDSRRVFERATALFWPTEIGEAMAATGGPTIPSQLKTMIKADGRDLVGELRALAPATPAVAIQRWSIRRLGLIVGTAAAAIVALIAALFVFFGVQPSEVGVPRCKASTPVLLAGQAVPEAAYAPCLADIPAAWDVERTTATDEGLEMDVSVRQDGGTSRSTPPTGSLEMRFMATASCPTVSGASRPGASPGVTVQEGTVDGKPAQVRRFDGGCVVLLADLESAPDWPALEAPIGLTSRAELDAEVARRTGGWADQLTKP
jgi:tRNA A-37 threonylcarbamoyl transferase component Bud32